jgi:hypothetical protein
MVARTATLLFLFFARSASAGGLVDHPIAGSSVTYLDHGWTASATIMPPRAPECTFEPNTDYNHGKVSGGHTGASTKEECCASCAKDALCAAAVFTTFSKGSCWLKTQEDLSKKSSVEGVTACVVKQSPGHGGKKVSIPASVPGDLISDLERAGMIGDPLYELNWLNSSVWDASTWTYTTAFAAPGAGGTSLLVFDGVKMGARVLVDGKQIGNTTDQVCRHHNPYLSL